jgi:DNA adenine methylase
MKRQVKDGDAPVRSPVKWAGGKRKLVSEIKRHFPATFGRYWEPFVGGGAVFFSLSEEEQRGAVLSDMNEPLVETYLALRDDFHELVRELGKEAYANTVEAYAKVRIKNFRVGSRAARAADFLYCNKAGFNGLFRMNLKGEFNVPFGRYDAIRFDFENLKRVSQALGRVSAIALQDFGRITPSKGDVVYFDSPYAPLSQTSSFTAYTAGGFGLAEQERLMKFALKLKRKGVTVVLSNSSAPLIKELYGHAGEFMMHEVLGARAVNSDKTKRGKVLEYVIT